MRLILSALPSYPVLSMKLPVSLLICLILCLVGYGGFFLWQGTRPARTPPPAAAAPGKPGARQPDAHPSRGPDADPEQALKDLADRWQASAASLPATSRQVKLDALCAEALSRLSASPALVEFCQFLAASGGRAQREWLTGPGLQGLFSGPQAAVAREQMLAVTDLEFRQIMAQHAGAGFGALGFKEFLDSLAPTPNVDLQTPLLAGLCITLASWLSKVKTSGPISPPSTK